MCFSGADVPKQKPVKQVMRQAKKRAQSVAGRAVTSGKTRGGGGASGPTLLSGGFSDSLFSTGGSILG